MKITLIGIKMNLEWELIFYTSWSLRLYSLHLFVLLLSQDEQEKLKKKKHFDFLDTLLAARVIET